MFVKGRGNINNKSAWKYDAYDARYERRWRKGNYVSVSRKTRQTLKKISPNSLHHPLPLVYKQKKQEISCWWLFFFRKVAKHFLPFGRKQNKNKTNIKKHNHFYAQQFNVKTTWKINPSIFFVFLSVCICFTFLCFKRYVRRTFSLKF